MLKTWATQCTQQRDARSSPVEGRLDSQLSISFVLFNRSLDNGTAVFTQFLQGGRIERVKITDDNGGRVAILKRGGSPAIGGNHKIGSCQGCLHCLTRAYCTACKNGDMHLVSTFWLY